METKPSSCKKIRIDPEIKDDKTKAVRDLVLKCDTYMGCILSSFTTLEYFRGMVMVSKYCRNFIEKQCNSYLIKKIQKRTLTCDG